MTSGGLCMKCPRCMSKCILLGTFNNATVYQCTYIVCGVEWAYDNLGRKRIYKYEEYKNSHLPPKRLKEVPKKG